MRMSNMKKLLIILLLFFPVHGAYSGAIRDFYKMPPRELPDSEVGDWCKKNLPGINKYHCVTVVLDKRKKPNYFDQFDDPPPEPKKPNKYEKYANPPPEPEEKTWLEKQKDKRKKKAKAKSYCSRKSGKANTTFAARKIYNACMEKKGY